MEMISYSRNFLLIGIIAVLLFLSSCKTNEHISTAPLESNKKQHYLAIAQAIKSKYDRHIDKLPKYQASHYAARIYRISGDTAYLKYSLRDLQAMQQETQELLEVAKNHTEAQYSQAKIKNWPSRARSTLRHKTLAIAPDFFLLLE